MKSLSPRAQKLLGNLAQDEAKKSGSTQLYPEHVILALLKSADGLGYALLQYLKINVLTFQLALEQSLQPQSSSVIFSSIPPSRRIHTLLDVAAIESRSSRKNYIGTEHIVIAAIREENSLCSSYFDKAKISLQDIRDANTEIYHRFLSSTERPLGHESEPFIRSGSSFFPFLSTERNENVFNSLNQEKQNLSQNQKSFSKNFDSSTSNSQSRKNDSSDSILTEFSRDLTAFSRQGKVDPVIARQKEIHRVIQVLSRRTKNNPILVGEPGVGKTAIVEGLAQKIASGDVPVGLRKKRVLTLDLASVIAGTKYRGEFEDRMKRIMKEIREQRDIILFIDELHTIIGAGGAEGSMDASNMLKPALSRGELQCIGATTLKEYRKYFEKDAALERRFQVVQVSEPSDIETVDILQGIKKKYEEYHNVVYEDDVISTIVKLSRRYIPARFLPDKAIDILDEAGAAKKIDEATQPIELAKIESKIAELTQEKKQMVQTQDYEQAARLRDEVLDLRNQLASYAEYLQSSTVNKKSVSAKDICSVISIMTGIPAEQLDIAESTRLLSMEKTIHQSIIGQEEAVRLVSSAIRRARTGVSSTHRPLGSFIFLGPTGVGKTLLAKTLATFLFGTEEALVRVDMSDYMEKHTSSRLVGAPPGYIGFEDGGVLTEKILRNPYSVVLLDEIEKAHPDVFNLLLQILEEGELKDNLGHTVNFRNTVIIMTSNAGAREISTENRLGFSAYSDGLLDYDEIKTNAMSELKKLLSPELINRIDDIIVFNALTKKEVSAVLDIQLKALSDRIADKNLSLTIRSSARDYLIEKGYDPSFGARPMRRLIQREIEDPLATKILLGETTDFSNLIIGMKKEKLSLSFSNKKQTASKFPKSDVLQDTYTYG